jgi:flagellar P-ring protein FlgI
MNICAPATPIRFAAAGPSERGQIRRLTRGLVVLVAVLAGGAAAADGSVRLKDLGHIEGAQDNALVGYGIVTGLAGTGDSPRNQATRQSIANLMSGFGMNVPNDQIQSRNVAAVVVMATLPAYSRTGSRIDVTVTSMGDARSLLGGTLVLTPLKGPDDRIHALAQGPVSVGGYRYDALGNLVQKNHPTVGRVPEGASVELAVATHDVSPDGRAVFALDEPDYTTANRIADSINSRFEQQIARARDASAIDIFVPPVVAGQSAVSFMTRLENIEVEPDQRARIVINERNGLVVSGGDVRISQVTITHGDLKISVVTDYTVSQPYPGIGAAPGPGVRTTVVPQTHLDVDEAEMHSVSLGRDSTVSDLVQALERIKTSPRDMISILQGIKTAGALHADLIIQ